MKQKIEIKRADILLYSGRISDMPIKNTSIIQKSIELFDDEDPCIIHQSYVIKEFADVILEILKSSNPLQIKNHQNIDFLNIDNPEECTISMKG